MFKKELKIVFMGSSDFAVSSLQKLLDDDSIKVLSVFTQPDKKVGRKRELKATPVKELAKKYNLTVHQPEKSKQIYDILKDEEIDFIVVVAYGHIIRQNVIDLPKYDILNIHGSLLPAFRGASPIHAALANGDTSLGVCVMRMVKELDAGPVYRCASLTLQGDDDFASMHDKLALAGSDLLVPVLLDIVSSDLIPKKQDDSKATFCQKITKEDSKIDFAKMSLAKIFNLNKAYKYWPKLWFEYKGRVYKLLEFSKSEYLDELEPGSFLIKNDRLFVGTTDGVLEIEVLQAESKKAMRVSDFLRGNQGLFE